MLISKGKRARMTTVNENTEVATTTVSYREMQGDEKLLYLREHKNWWLLEVPHMPELVMVVEGRVYNHCPFSSSIQKGDHYYQYNQRSILQRCNPPFIWDKGGVVTGGRCWYRAKQEGEELDLVPEGATIGKSQGNKVWPGEQYRLELPIQMSPRFKALLAKKEAGLLAAEDRKAVNWLDKRYKELLKMRRSDTQSQENCEPWRSVCDWFEGPPAAAKKRKREGGEENGMRNLEQRLYPRFADDDDSD